MPHDPLVYVRRDVLMQRLLDSVVRGYRYHTFGSVPVAKATSFSDKLNARYGVYLTEGQRRHAKMHRRANARLLLFAVASDSELHWWLLATAGTGAVHAEERLRDAHARDQRVRVGESFELLPLTRPRHLGGGTTWTWRMTRHEVDVQRTLVVAACRRSDPQEAQRIVTALSRAPGYAGVRRQVGALIALMRREWRRHGSLDRLPPLTKLRYVERLPSTGIRLSELCHLNGVGTSDGRSR